MDQKQSEALTVAQRIFGEATPILAIRGLRGPRWKRNVAKGSRIGPWLQADYQVLDHTAWMQANPCLYLVAGADSGIRYVGISRNGVKHRWRTSPAYDAETMTRLPRDQLFHSQCWKHIEQEWSSSPDCQFEVRVISAIPLAPLLERLGPPVSAFTALRDDGESLVASVERWLCNRRSTAVARWNSSMAAVRNAARSSRDLDDRLT